MSVDLRSLKAYDYELPKELIAQKPLEKRSSSRLLHLNKQTGELRHMVFSDIAALLHPGDLMVVNSSKVFPARLFGKKENGTKIELLLLNELATGKWQCLVSPGKRVKTAQWLSFSPTLKGFISIGDPEGLREITFEPIDALWQEIYHLGHVPLPPYIERNDTREDSIRYQTVFAREVGSVAAPTAGLHFDEALLKSIKDKGVEIVDVTLHVGIGTFRPVKTQDITAHTMHKELAAISASTALAIDKAKAEGRRIVCVGTTSVRTVESFYGESSISSGTKWTDIFIYPGYEFKVPDAIITNFHLPQSTLLMMISAFAGHDLIMKAYQEAVLAKYRFFSYGDAMFIEA